MGDIIYCVLNLILTIYGPIEFGASIDEIKYVLHLPNNIENGKRRTDRGDSKIHL